VLNVPVLDLIVEPTDERARVRPRASRR
jgi:hypothetical protein